MTLDTLIELCLLTEQSIVPGDYTILISNSKSGSLNAGVLLFTDADLPKNQVDRIEYRLVSILVMLIDIDQHLAEQDSRKDFEISIDIDAMRNIEPMVETLIQALTARGIAKSLAEELVNGPQPNG